MPSNFKTYESQARLLAAVIASSPGLKLDFKAIAKHYGSDTTTSGIEHRFRPIKKQAAAIRSAVSQGVDPKDIQDIVAMNEKEIAKHYGESTAQGLEFQFRTIKKDAKALQEAVQNGQNPATALANKAPSTPSKRKAPVTPRTGGSTAKRPRKTPKKEIQYSDDEDKDIVDFEALDVKTPSKKKAAPSNHIASTEAAIAAAVAIVPSDPGMTHEATPVDDGFGSVVTPHQEQPDFSLKDELDEHLVHVKLEHDPLLSQGIDGEEWDMDDVDGVI